MSDTEDFLRQHAPGTVPHATMSYHNLLPLPSHTEEQKRHLLVILNALGKTVDDFTKDRAAVARANELHRTAMNIVNAEAQASSKRQLHGQALQEAKEKHAHIDREVAAILEAANGAETDAANARDARIQLFSLRNQRPDLFGPGTPFAGLTGDRQPGDEGPAN
jgi:hypothetical protein